MRFYLKEMQVEKAKKKIKETKKRRDERDNSDPHRELYDTVPVNFIYLYL